MWLSSWLCVPARTTWPCSHQSSGAEWSLSVCQVVVWGQSQPCLCVIVGGPPIPLRLQGSVSSVRRFCLCRQPCSWAALIQFAAVFFS